MPTVNVFVSFEFGKDNGLRGVFEHQAKNESDYSLCMYSLDEPYRENVWKSKARTAIRKCDIVFVLVGQDTHNASGVMVETDMAVSLKKPVVQILSKKARRCGYQGIRHIEDRIPWRWETIDEKIEELT